MLLGVMPDHAATTYGLTRDSILNESRYFHITEGLAPDCMHDLLEGTMQYEVKELVKYITQKGYISLEGINEKTIVYDIVYRPINTDFIKKAKERGAKVIFGYEMLLGQAVRAFEIWHDMQAPYNAMKKALLGGF